MIGHKICFYSKNMDNFAKIIHIFTVKTFFSETVLMIGHKICFYSKNMDNFRKIIPVTPSYLDPFLSGAPLLIHQRK